jgi:peptide/nickel transport system permease protein
VLARFILRRLGLSLLTLALLSVVVFVGVQVLPGDTARAILGPLADPRAVEALNRQLGTDRPALTLYVEWIAKLLSGDLGQSYIYRAPVASFIGPALLNSLKLAAMVFAIVVPLAIGAGVLAALHAGRPLDRASAVQLVADGDTRSSCRPSCSSGLRRLAALAALVAPRRASAAVQAAPPPAACRW